MNLFDFDISDALGGETESVVYEDTRIRVVRIVSMGQTTPHDSPYEQSENEWVCVLRGNAELYLCDDGRRLSLDAGSSVMLEAGVRHLVTKTSSPCVWLCIFEKVGNGK